MVMDDDDHHYEEEEECWVVSNTLQMFKFSFSVDYWFLI
jgi:hypothetical protein